LYGHVSTKEWDRPRGQFVRNTPGEEGGEETLSPPTTNRAVETRKGRGWFEGKGGKKKSQNIRKGGEWPIQWGQRAGNENRKSITVEKGKATEETKGPAAAHKASIPLRARKNRSEELKRGKWKGSSVEENQGVVGKKSG